MNPTRLREIADLIEDAPQRFSMADFFGQYVDDSGNPTDDPDGADNWLPVGQDESVVERFVVGESCGTTACVAGWAAAFYEPQRLLEGEGVVDLGAEVLELTWKTCRSLFYSSAFWRDVYPQTKFSALTAGQVADVLRCLADGTLQLPDWLIGANP